MQGRHATDVQVAGPEDEFEDMIVDGADRIGADEPSDNASRIGV
ncbi:MAG TPA: hypothetical protein VFP65_25255 [Anaeromyxobacteraceae bacterium]|nr:hypothetical protein [Anaeromyxobacteraceae bacterium]